MYQWIAMTLKDRYTTKYYWIGFSSGYLYLYYTQTSGYLEYTLFDVAENKGVLKSCSPGGNDIIIWMILIHCNCRVFHRWGLMFLTRTVV